MSFIDGYKQAIAPMHSKSIGEVIKSIEAFHVTSGKYLHVFREIRNFLNSDNRYDKKKLSELLYTLGGNYLIPFSSVIENKAGCMVIEHLVKGADKVSFEDAFASYIFKNRKKILPAIDDSINEILEARSDVAYNAFREVTFRMS